MLIMEDEGKIEDVGMRDLSISDSLFPQITAMPAPPSARKSKQQMQKELRELLDRAASGAA